MSILEKKYKRNPEVVTRKIKDIVILVSAKKRGGESEIIFTLNEVAEIIWDQMNGTNSLWTIRDNILDRFDVPASTVEEDLADTVGKLEKLGLIYAVTSCGKEER